MLLSVLKVIFLILFVNVIHLPLSVANDNEINYFNSSIPADFRKKWAVGKLNQPAFDLLTPTEKNRLNIEKIAAYGEKQNWKNFVPRINRGKNLKSTEVSPTYAAVDFMNRASLLFLEGKDHAATFITGKLRENANDLLTIKSTKLRSATSAERAINLRATATIARAHAYENKSKTHEFWVDFFKSKHSGELLSNKRVLATINTRAAAAALVSICANNNFLENRQFLFEAVKRSSGIDNKVFEAFAQEINKATDSTLQGLVAYLELKETYPIFQTNQKSKTSLWRSTPAIIILEITSYLTSLNFARTCKNIYSPFSPNSQTSTQQAFQQIIWNVPVNEIKDFMISKKGKLPQISFLRVFSTDVSSTDESLLTLKNLTELKSLTINVKRFTDESLFALIALRSLTELKSFPINANEFTDETVPNIGCFPSLHTLNIGSNEISWVGLRYLVRRLPKLSNFHAPRRQFRYIPVNTIIMQGGIGIPSGILQPVKVPGNDSLNFMEGIKTMFKE